MKVAPHTSLKHRMLGAYFLICRQVAKTRVLHYVDLYAGDGEAECENAPLQKWKSPFIKCLLEHAVRETIKLKCFLNELNKEYFAVLKKNVAQYEKFIIGLTNKNANVVYSEILQQVPKDEWSIFFLDPYSYSDLDWKTIEEISKHEGLDITSRCKRKPELIINLMTYTMQRAFKSDPTGITKALGTDEWKSKIEKKMVGEKVHQIFSDIFIKRLEMLGYTVNSFCIKQTLPNNNILYYIIFASSVPNANEIITKKYKPYVDDLMADKWIKENFEYGLITKAKKAKIKSLNDF